MEDYKHELYHYGIKGMKWGVRRTAAQLGHVVKTGYKKTKAGIDNVRAKRAEKKDAEVARQRSKIKSPKKLTTEELEARIKRLKLEKEYVELERNTAQVSLGQKVLKDILESSTKNIGGQTVTYMMGKGVNLAFKDIFGEDIVNPKKGQKDK